MKKEREHWGSTFGFIMATAGSAIGLGSLWRFPYIVGQNGGGAFVILYIIFTFLIGLPVFLGELIIGRRTQKSAVLAYKSLTPEGSNWGMLGYLNLLTCFVIFSFYSVVAGWCLCYILMSLSQFSVGKSPQEIQAIFDTLLASPGINLFWLFVFILINIGIVFSGVRKGIEKWSKILTPAFIIFLVVLFAYSCTLPGFGQAVNFLLVPYWDRLSGSGVLNALGMAFFTLSVALGIILTYGSYMKKDEDMPKNGAIVACMTVLISLFASLMIFPIVFTYGFSPQGGPGLVFKTMPVIFAQLPGNVLISSIFFTLLLFTALTSSISLLEVIVANLIEIREVKRHRATWFAGCLTFVLGIPSALSYTGSLFPSWEKIYGKNFFDTMDYLTASWAMPIAGLFSVLFVAYVMNKRDVEAEFKEGTSWKWLYPIWLFMVRFLAPAAVLVIILQEAGLLNFSKLFKS
ncbi:MAG: hypothetical protein S4CHLAM102_14150 [Chlamydiia bacterium]|nr:hypothetical protein [Chlamydiia bacterium]